MKSLRLNAILEFIDSNDKVADIGCDHAYLAIHLAKNNLCNKVIATDINQNALKIAQNNIQKNNLDKKINTYLSDGLTNVTDKDINTLVIAGMGSSTILHIIDNATSFKIKKYIIQTNNYFYKLRTNLEKKQIYLQNEKIVYEKKHFYIIGYYSKEYKRLKIREKLFGLYKPENKDYYLYLYNELENINKKIKFTCLRKKLEILIKKNLLKKYL